MGISTMNISLPDNLRAEIEGVVESEGYGNTSEFFRDLARRYLQERQDRRLEALILEGIKSGEPTPFTERDFEAIRTRGVQRIKRRLQK